MEVPDAEKLLPLEEELKGLKEVWTELARV